MNWSRDWSIETSSELSWNLCSAERRMAHSFVHRSSVNSRQMRENERSMREHAFEWIREQVNKSWGNSARCTRWSIDALLKFTASRFVITFTVTNWHLSRCYEKKVGQHWQTRGWITGDERMTGWLCVIVAAEEKRWWWQMIYWWSHKLKSFSLWRWMSSDWKQIYYQ